MRLFISAIIFCAVIAASIHLYESHEQDRMLQLSKGDPRLLAELLIKAEGQRARPCSTLAVEQQSEFDVLMSAIATMERFGTSTIERLAEGIAIRGVALLGLPVPNLSLGEGQVRVSTALRASQAFEPTHPIPHVDRNTLALRLLGLCENHRAGVRVLMLIAKEHELRTDALDRAGILAIAATYNGQAVPRGLPDFVAKHTYTEAVYHLYHALNFALLR